jgi:hypothetical protein
VSDPTTTHQAEHLGQAVRSALAYTLLGAARMTHKIRGSQPPTAIRARARLESARIEERYHYFQEVSANASVAQSREPTGHIAIVLPCDGDQHFTRQACQDVAYARRAGATGLHAQVGFIALGEYEKNFPGLHDKHGTLPIEMLLPEHPRLLADDSACVIRHDYHPSQLDYAPVSLIIRIDDLDTAGFQWPRGRNEPGNPDWAATQLPTIMRNAGFRQELVLSMTVIVRMRQQLARQATAKISEVFLSWPTRTSVSQLRLRAQGRAHDVRYNPERGGLEWSDVALAADQLAAGQLPASDQLRVFRCKPMRLVIPQPSDLYRQERLTGQVDVRVDRLLSGMTARLYDATGRPAHPHEPELTSTVSTEFGLILDDAFAARSFQSFQHLHFGDVVPDETRIDDIATALRNRGFEVDHWRASEPDTWWVAARRTLGPDTLRLVVLVDGRRHKTKHRREVADGLTYETEVDGGELRIFMAGDLNGDPAPVVRETNELRRALRERFDRLPARR